MTDRLATRFASLTLAVFVTWAVFAGIDAMALDLNGGATQMSQASAASQVAARKLPASRS